jgi:chaperonin cofactor prefoldin
MKATGQTYTGNMMIAEDYTEEDVCLEDLKKEIDDLHLEIRYISHLAENLVKEIKSLIDAIEL